MVHTMPIDTISLRDSLSCVCQQSGEPLSNWFDWVSLIASVATLICFAIPQWFVSFEPSTRASTFMGSVKNKLVDLLAHSWQLATITAWA